MKTIITSVLITISSVVTAQNTRTSYEQSHIFGSRNGMIMTISYRPIIRKTNKAIRAGYRNTCIGNQSGKQVENKKTQKLDTIPCLLIITDTSEYDYKFRGYGVFEKILDVSYVKGFEVVERHSTAENSVDPGIASCVDSKGNPIPCYYDYFKHFKYIDSNKKPFRKQIIIIQKIK